jgi:uncharacterized membrane protein
MTETVAKGEWTMRTNRDKILKLVETAVLAALVVVLQTMVFIPMGPFTITLTLVPIMIGAIMLGPVCGAILGGVFGVVVAIQVPIGALGLYSKMMFDYAPVITEAICVLKGIAAGLTAGLVYRALARLNKPFLSTVLAAISCPIVNTGVFAIGLMGFYGSLVNQWTIDNQFANAFAFLMLFMIGLNFVVEFAINVVLAPAIVRVVKMVKNRF